MSKITILITAIGSANGLNVLNALRLVKSHSLHLIGVDSNPLSAGLQLCDQGYVISSIKNEEQYFSDIYSIIEKEKVDVVLPIFSKEIPLFAQNQELFEKITTIKLCIPKIQQISNYQDKYLFYKILKENNYLSPKTEILNERYEEIEDKFKFPFIIKNRLGSGSKSVWIVKNKANLQNFIQNAKIQDIREKKFIIQEFIEGKEYTIDFCCNFESKFLGAVIRERIEVRDGKCFKGKTVNDREISNKIKNLLHSISFIGPGNIQIIQAPDGQMYFIELNPRFAAGGLPLTIEAGFNIPWIISQLILDPTQKFPVFQDYPQDLYMIRYYNEVFINGKVKYEKS